MLRNTQCLKLRKNFLNMDEQDIQDLLSILPIHVNKRFTHF